MAEPSYLKNAPITEALIDFRVKLPTDFKFEQLAPVQSKLVSTYPKVEERRSLEGKIEIRPGPQVTQSTKDTGPCGYWLRSQDDLDIVQFRIDGFTYNRLKPYTCWEKIFPHAMELWKLYNDHVSVEAITRVAVRYINHIRIPLPINDLTDYLEAPPRVPSQLPQDLRAFLSRSVIHDPATGISVNIIQAKEPGIDDRFATILLDIDAYKNVELSPADEKLSATFEKLRETKNLVFFGSITESAKRLFE